MECGHSRGVCRREPRPFVIPELKSWHGGEGRFVPTEDTRIVYPSGDETLERVARMLADDCAEMFGFRPAIAAGRGGRGDVSLAVKADKELGDEGYAVAISGKRVDVKAPHGKRGILGDAHAAADGRAERRSLAAVRRGARLARLCRARPYDRLRPQVHPPCISCRTTLRYWPTTR